MPLVEIFSPSLSREVLHEAGAAVHEALVEAFKIPPDDRFQLLHQLAHSAYIADPHYLGITRTADGLVVRINLRRGRTPEMKQALYRTIAEKVTSRTPVRAEDILIVLVENELIDWSFGNGVAQYGENK